MRKLAEARSVLRDSKRILDNRFVALKPLFDIDGPLVAVVFGIPRVFVEESAAARLADQQSDDCRYDDATTRMEPGDQGRASVERNWAAEFGKKELVRQAEFGP